VDRVAKSDPGNAGLRRDLSISNDKVGQALLDLGRVEESVSNFNAAIQIGNAPDNSEFYWRRALAKLYMNDAAAAADDAATALKLRPAYPYYAIWLHVARARAGQNDADEIAANAKNIDRAQWPWPIVALLLGLMNPGEVQTAAAAAEQQSTRVAQSCEANFFIGVYQIEKGAQAEARPLFQSAVDHCPYHFVQYAAAKLELKRLDDPAGAQAK
jgi:lipoprotein NlpI